MQQTILHTAVNTLQNSLDFYTRLGFRTFPVEQNEMHLLDEGKVLIELNPDRYARPGIKIFRDSWKETLPELEKRTRVFPYEGGYLVYDPNGIPFYLSEKPSFTYKPGESHSLCGNFMGLSIEASDLEQTGSFWELLGFELTPSKPGASWLVMQSPDGLGVNAMVPRMCPHLFFNPSFTFFNSGKNLEIIRKIREQGVPIAEEVTHFNKEGIADNLVLRDPGGFGFFVFND